MSNYNFASFFEVLRGMQKEYWIAEELANDTRIGEKRMKEAQFNQLQK